MTIVETHRALLKAHAWWLQQQRDEYGRWTKGYVTGAFSPIGGTNAPGKPDFYETKIDPVTGKKSKKLRIAAPAIGLAGSPTGVGGALHGKSDWVTQPGWKGQEHHTKAQHEAAMKAYVAQQKDMATPQDLTDHIQSGAEDHAQANDMGALSQTLMRDGGAAQGGVDARVNEAQLAAAMQGMAAMDNREEPGVGSGFDDEAFDIPQSLQNAGYPPPQAGEPIVPPPGQPMPHEAAAQAAAETAETWPSVEATPFKHAQTGGTNEGGFYEINGVKGYAKFYKNPEQAQSEKLANDLYRACGISAPVSHLVSINGKKAIFNELVDAQHMTPAEVQNHPHMHAGFAMDAILANHDVIGATHDNIVQNAQGAMRLDNGGALKFRAQGAAKNGLDYDKVGQFDSMRDLSVGAGKTFHKLSDEAVAQQVADVAGVLTPDKISAAVAAAGFTGDQYDDYTKLLNGRIEAAKEWAHDRAPHVPMPDDSPEDMASAAAANTAAKLTEETKAPTGNPIADNLPSAITKDVADDVFKGKKPEAGVFSDSFADALHSQDVGKFVKSLTPEILKKAARKAWYGETGQWAAKTTAAVLSHLTGKQHAVVDTVTGGVRVKPTDNAEPVVAQPPAPADDATSLFEDAKKQPHYGTSSGEAAYLDSPEARTALMDWKTKGKSMKPPSHDALVAIASSSFALPYKKTAQAAAGFLSHSTGDKWQVKVNDDTGSLTLVPSGEKIDANEDMSFPDHGLPDPGTHEFNGTYAKQPHALLNMMGYLKKSPSQVQDEIQELNDQGHHKLADWLKVHAEANHLLGEPSVKPGQEDQFLGESVDYKNMPSTFGDTMTIIKSTGKNPSELAGEILQNPHVAAAIFKGNWLPDFATHIQAALDAAGIDAHTVSKGDGSLLSFQQGKGGVLPAHVDQAKADLEGEHKEGTDKPGLFHSMHYDDLHDGAWQNMGEYTGAAFEHNGLYGAPDPEDAPEHQAAAEKLVGDHAAMETLANGSQSHESANAYAALLNSYTDVHAVVVPSGDGEGYKLHMSTKPDSETKEKKPTGDAAPPDEGHGEPHSSSELYQPNYSGAGVDDAAFDKHQALIETIADMKENGLTPSGATLENLKKKVANLENDGESLKALVNLPWSEDESYKFADAINEYGSKYEATTVSDSNGDSHLFLTEKSDKGAQPQSSEPVPSSTFDTSKTVDSYDEKWLHKYAKDAAAYSNSGNPAMMKHYSQYVGNKLDAYDWKDKPYDSERGKAYGKYITSTKFTPVKANNLAIMVNAGSNKFDASVYAEKVKDPATGKSKTVYRIHLYPKGSGKTALHVGKPKKDANGNAVKGNPLIGTKSSKKKLPQKTLNPLPIKPTPAHHVIKPIDIERANDEVGDGPLHSQHSTASMIAHGQKLPDGVSRHDVAQSSPKKQQALVQSLRDRGYEAGASFLENHFAHKNSEPVHPMAKTGQSLYLGKSEGYASPRQTPQQVADAVINGGRNLPDGVTLSALDAETPEAQHKALQGPSGNGLYYTSIRWLKEYYKNREEAKAAAGDVDLHSSPGSLQSVAHPSFGEKGVYSARDGVREGDPHTYSQGNVNADSYGGAEYTASAPGTKHTSDFARQKAREEPITGASGKSYDPTHLSLEGKHNVPSIAAAAASKAKDIFADLLSSHIAKVESGYKPADPFGSLGPNGVHPQSAHAYKLTVTHFEPMLDAARACVPSREAIDAFLKEHGRERGRYLAAAIFNQMCHQMGIDESACEQFINDTHTWQGSAQSDSAYRARVASNMLRGIRPGENTKFEETHAAEQNYTEKVARGIHPDYMKAMLANKAITQAFMERISNKNNQIPMVRGIGTAAATSMLGKSVSSALANDEEGHKFRSSEMTLSGFSMSAKAARNFSDGNHGAFLHRMVTPEQVWESQWASAAHSSAYTSEQEHFIQNDGGGEEYTLTSNSTIGADGNFVSIPSYDTDPRIRAHFGAPFSYANMPGNIVKSMTQFEHIPTDTDGWFQPVPHDWSPTPEQAKACLDHFTKNGVFVSLTDRDLGWRNEFSSPEVRKAVAEGKYVQS